MAWIEIQAEISMAEQHFNGFFYSDFFHH